MEDKKKFMARAIELSINSANTIGGPFGSVIVKNDKIIAAAIILSFLTITLPKGPPMVFALLIDSSIALAINFFLSSILIFNF